MPIKQKTLSGNALRGHLAKFGLFASKGIGRVDAPIAKAATGAPLPDIAKAALQAAENRRQRIRPACVRVRARFFRFALSNAPQNARGGKILWWLSAHQGHLMPFAQEPGSITKQGKWSIRRPRVPGEAIAVKRMRRSGIVGAWLAGTRKGVRRDWLAALLSRKSARLVAVALANELARIISAVTRRGVSHAGLKTSLGNADDGVTFQNIRIGKGETDVLNGRVEIADEGHPVSCRELQNSRPCLRPSPSNSIRARGHGSAQ